MSLKLYGAPISGNVNPIVALCTENGIPFELIPTNPMAGETKTLGAPGRVDNSWSLCTLRADTNKVGLFGGMFCTPTFTPLGKPFVSVMGRF